MTEEEEGKLREEGEEEEGGQAPTPCYEVAVEDRPVSIEGGGVDLMI